MIVILMIGCMVYFASLLYKRKASLLRRIALCLFVAELVVDVVAALSTGAATYRTWKVYLPWIALAAVGIFALTVVGRAKGRSG